LAYFYIILGAACGAPLRYYLQGRLQDSTGLLFPIGTLVVNLSGCFAIGMLAALVEDRGFLDRNMRIAVLTGFLGSYTTFSTFAYESVEQLTAGELTQAAVNILVSVVGGIAAAWAGATLVRWA
jgi:CrcB protein